MLALQTACALNFLPDLRLTVVTHMSSFLYSNTF